MTYESSNPMYINMRNDHDHVRDPMTVSGVAQKSLLMIFLVFISAFFAITNPIAASIVSNYFIALVIVVIGVALITAFVPKIAYMTTPIYAIVEGAILGFISITFNILYPGIIIQAVLLTLGVFFIMFMLYSNKILRATPMFRKIIIASTFAIMFVYLFSFIGSFFGFNVPFIHGSGPIGIIFSLVVVGIASFNLILDFDFIEKGSKQKLAKYYEWYATFALLVTLIWLYIEILRLLAKLKDR